MYCSGGAGERNLSLKAGATCPGGGSQPVEMHEKGRLVCLSRPYPAGSKYSNAMFLMVLFPFLARHVANFHFKTLPNFLTEHVPEHVPVHLHLPLHLINWSDSCWNDSTITTLGQEFNRTTYILRLR